MRVWRRVSEAGEQPAADAHDQRRDDHYVPVALCELDFRYKSTLHIQPQKLTLMITAERTQPAKYFSELRQEKTQECIVLRTTDNINGSISIPELAAL